MLNQSLTWAFFTLGSLSVVSLLYSIYTWPAGERCRCSGKSKKWYSYLSPTKFFLRGQCWYNLHGLAPDSTKLVMCPECGKKSNKIEILRDGRRLRTGRAGVLLGLIATAAITTLIQREGTWVAVIPTAPLVVMNNTKVGEHRTKIRAETIKRVNAGTVKGWTGRTLAWTLAEDLRHDETRWNAHDAYQALWKMWPECQEALENEVMVGGSQSRVIAAKLLRWNAKTPSTGLIEACIKDLRDDRGEPGAYLRMGNSKQATVYLTRWWSYSKKHVQEVLQSDDPQQRFMAAIIAGYSGSFDDIEVALPTLLPHIYDNDEWGDAKIAAPAIYNFGPAVIPYLLKELAVADEQAHAILLHIIERLENTELTYLDCKHPMPRITSNFHDPVSCSLSSMIEYYWE